MAKVMNNFHFPFVNPSLTNNHHTNGIKILSFVMVYLIEGIFYIFFNLHETMTNSGNHCTVCIKHRGLTKVSIKGCRRRPSNQKLELLVSFCGRESEKGFDQEIKPGKSIKEAEIFSHKLLHSQTNCFVLFCFYMRKNTCSYPLFVPLICL